MGKIGSFDYPETQFGTLLKAADVLVNKFAGQANDEKTFAEALGHNSNKSGAFLTKLADMRKYGLIDKRGITATQRAKNIVKYLTLEERQKELNKAVMEITLWKTLYERIGNGRMSLEDFRIHLVEVTGDRDKAMSDAENIKNLYIDAISLYSESVVKHESKGGINLKKEQEIPPEKGEKVPEDVIVFKSGVIDMTIPKNDETITFLVNMLNSMKKNKTIPK